MNLASIVINMTNSEMFTHIEAPVIANRILQPQIHSNRRAVSNFGMESEQLLQQHANTSQIIHK